LVRLGSARRVTAAGLGFCVCASSAMRLTAAGVGVAGSSVPALVVRRLRGVEGAASASSAAETSVALRLRVAAGGGSGGVKSVSLVLLTMPARRADRRDAMFTAGYFQATMYV
jgi:hypothetical protein